MWLYTYLYFIDFFSKGCMEIQNPPQFTLEEVITIDFSDAGEIKFSASKPKSMNNLLPRKK